VIGSYWIPYNVICVPNVRYVELIFTSDPHEVVCGKNLLPGQKSAYGDWLNIPLQHVPVWNGTIIYVDSLALELQRRIRVRMRQPCIFHCLFN